MIGTSVSLQNSEQVLYPSVTICLNHYIAKFQGDILHDSSDSNKQIFNLSHTPDLSDVLNSLSQSYGPITNMSYISIAPNTSSFIGPSTAVEKRDVFCHPYIHEDNSYRVNFMFLPVSLQVNDIKKQ